MSVLKFEFEIETEQINVRVVRSIETYVWDRVLSIPLIKRKEKICSIDAPMLIHVVPDPKIETVSVRVWQ